VRRKIGERKTYDGVVGEGATGRRRYIVSYIDIGRKFECKQRKLHMEGRNAKEVESVKASVAPKLFCYTWHGPQKEARKEA
jgi:hypothetical protein